jgi:hypothetical protein
MSPKIIVEVPENCMNCKFRSKLKKVFRYCLLFQKHLKDMEGSDKTTIGGLARCQECKDAEIKGKG